MCRNSLAIVYFHSFLMLTFLSESFSIIYNRKNKNYKLSFEQKIKNITHNTVTCSLCTNRYIISVTLLVALPIV